MGGRSGDLLDRRTSRRGFTCVLEFSDSDTNVDPVSVLMGNESAFIGKINNDDFKKMCSRMNWNEDRGTAYIESVVGAPFYDLSDPVVVSHTRANKLITSPVSYNELVVWTQGKIRDSETDKLLGPTATNEALKTLLGSEVSANIIWKANSLEYSVPKLTALYAKGDRSIPHIFWTKQTLEFNSPQCHEWSAMDEISKNDPLDPLVMWPYLEEDEERTLKDLHTEIRIWYSLRTGRNPVKQTVSAAPSKSTLEYVPWVTRNMSYRSLPVQISYQSSHGLLWRGNRPQLYSSTLFGDNTVELTPYDMSQPYVNNDPFVEMIPFNREIHNDYDFCWKQLNDEYFMRKLPAQGEDSSNMFVVGDSTFFLGMGSVAIAWATTLGAGAGIHQRKIRQVVARRYKTDDVSGHALSALLMHSSHFYWYLYEIYLNHKSSKSVYAFPFREQKSGRYHSISEYKGALDAALQLNLPDFAIKRLGQFTKFLKKLDL
ncbi:VP7 [Micromonas pusilla reovirus]|uniref:Putative non-structural protein 1 n=1 Tax=Micromonas pusilla reovirus (isolate Netherlands/2005) TaxID=649596 RepID=NS1_MPRVN|nr:VP7 [Micromonas pusilla reovirus]Q1I0U5.1 RecName: Full=Putative non-structural protein 1; Short=NS1 [Micromonas pusilla reovirus (isolate Netherlands)]AAZ94047.1 VP7 [Micromonas pusilla reovirus]